MKLPTLPKMPRPSEECFRVGDYWLHKFGEQDYWIEHASGEGMQVRREVMEKLIEDFYCENF